MIIIILLIVVAVGLIVGWFILGCYCLIGGIENKYGESDKQLFQGGGECPDIYSKED